MATLILSGQVESNELRYTPDSIPVCTLQLSFIQFNGTNREPTPCVVDVIAWNDLAQSASQQFEIGSYLIAQGQPIVHEVDPSQQPKRRVLSLRANRLQPGAEHLNLNLIALSGRVGGDPEIRYFESGAIVSHVSLAVRQGKQQTSWFALEGWGKQAETLTNYVHKGDPLGIEGYLKIDTWQEEEVKRSKPVIGILAMQLLGTKTKVEEEEEF